MDIALLAKETVALLAPLLPYLLKAGDKAVETVGEKVGEKALIWGGRLWDKLKSKAETRPAVKEALEDTSKTPSDEDAQGALRLQLKKLLAEDRILAQQVAELLTKAKADGVTILAAGERSVAARE